MILPPHLKKGDTVAIVATARKVTVAELQPAVTLLTKWGLHVVFGATIGAEADQYAGDDALRSNDFQQALNNKNIQAIWCARGGYGTIRIIDSLDFSGFAAHPKWIVGYSDVTVLHAHIHTLGIATLHAQMPLEIEIRSEQTARSIKNVLFGNKHAISMASEGISFNRTGTANGVVVGGNLSVLYSLIGSDSALDTRNKILFIEDLDEMLYHIDRMMVNLKRSGMLKELKGLIVGGMTDMRDNRIPFGKSAEQSIWEAVQEYDYPVCFYFPAGHIHDNRALIMGQEATLEVTPSQVSLTY